MTFLYKADPARGAVWAKLFAERAPDVPFRIWPDLGDPALIQTGRGAHLVQEDLLRLLDDGHLRYALLDVTTPEPLPSDHPLWTHPRVRITPHIASATRPETAVESVLENLRRHRSGLPMIGEVDRQRGY